MTFVTITRALSLSDSCRRQAGYIVASCRSRITESRRRARSRRELRQLSNHDLQDIGRSRADAEFEALKPFWRE